MRKIGWVLIVATLRCWATSYYVSNAGADGNSGTSAGAAWQTLARVNAQTLAPGDIIYLERGGVWVEPLIPGSSGTAGNPIWFDAYGTGAAPVITAASAIPFVSGSWTYISGNVWKATVPNTIASPSINNVQFGRLWGNRKTGSCTAAIAGKYDWCYVWASPNLFLYVWSPAGTNPVVTYAADGVVTPIVAQGAGLQLIYVNGKSWLTFQHIKVQAFDYVGVGVAECLNASAWAKGKAAMASR